MLELQAFGPVDLKGDGGDLTSVLAQPKRLALLTYLVVARPRGHHRRDTLLALFWPELDQSHGRKALSQSLFFLRRALPDPVLVTRGTEEVGVDFSQVRCDVLAFEEALEEEDWSRALARYRGELLAGFHVSDVPDFERWLDTERELAAGAAWSLAKHRIAAGELVAAERAAQQAILLVPTEETPVRAFIKALAAAGDRAAALAFYEKFRTTLAVELEVEPAPETAEVAAALRVGELAAGREQEPGPMEELATGTGQEPGPMEAGTAIDPGPAFPPGRDLGSGPGPDGPGTGPAPGRSHRNVPAAKSGHHRILWPWLAAAAAVLTVITAALLVRSSSGTAFTTVPHRVAVLPFENLTGNPSFDQLGVEAADWINGGLTRIDTLQVIPTSTITQILSEEGASGSGPERIARRTGAGLVVTGSIVSLGDSLEVRAQLLDPAEGRVLDYFEAGRSHRSMPATALGPIRLQITGRIALRLDDRVTGLASVKDPEPPDYDAYRAYLGGVDLFFSGRYPGAIRELDRAWRADPDFVAPGIWIASAFGNLGEPARQDSVLTLLEAHRADLSPIQLSGVEIMRAGLQGDHTTIYRIASEGLRKSPTTEGRLFTGVYAFHTNRLREAVQTLRNEPESGPTRSRMVGFHQVLTDALHALGEHEEEWEAAQEAQDRFPERPEPITMKVRALVALGRIQDAMSALQEGMALPREDWSPADLQIQAGLELRRHGHPDLGEATILGALEWLQAHEDAPDRTYSAAQAHLWIGQPDSAVILFRELVGESPGTIDYHGYLGIAHAAAGGSREAKDVRARLKEWQEPYIRGRHLYWSAAISAWLGEEDQALSLLRDAMAQGITPSSLRENEAFRPLWTHPPFQELLEPRGG